MSREALAQAAVDKVWDIQRRLGIPRSFSELGVPRSDMPRIVEAVLAFPGPLVNNPRPVSREDIEAIYSQLLPR